MKIHLLIAFAILRVAGFSQDVPDLLLEELVSRYSESSDLDPDEEEVQLLSTKSSKININRLNPDDLSGIPFLTPRQTKNLTDYLSLYGEVYSLYELQAIEGFDSALIVRMMPYLDIGPPREDIRLTPGNLLRKGRHDLVFRYQQVMQQEAGYQQNKRDSLDEPDQNFLGSPQRYYFRYRYTCYDKVLIGFSGDKDAGEAFFRGSQALGMDFYSGFVAVQHVRWLKQAILGNFRVSFGQGLTLGGNSFGSSITFGSSMKYNGGFRPSQSVCEYGYLNGAAVTVRTGPVEWSGFLSTVQRDAALYASDSMETANRIFTSFSESGYHRTESEIARKNQVREWVYGGHAGYRGRFFMAGVSGFYGTWDGIFQPRDDLYQRFMLQGNRFGALGVDGRFRVGFAQVFGEFSISLNGGKAWLAGISAIPTPGVDLLLICRSYDPSFQNPFSTAVSQNSSSNNEQGLYIRLETQVIPKTTIGGYVDVFRSPWIKYRVNGPSVGTEGGVMCHYQASGSWNFSLRYSLRRGAMNSTLSKSKTTPLMEEKRDDLKVSCSITATPTIILKSCFVVRSYRIPGREGAFGYLASQELSYRRTGIIRAIRLKFSLFDAPDYNTRIYTYEPDLLYSFSAPACYGRGFRFVLLLQSGIRRWFDISGWFGLVKYMDRKSIGSGLSQITGSLKSELKVQLRVRL